jgi:tRNA pseudouridine38-40 synthase
MSNKNNIKLTISYDGSISFGFQDNKSCRTIEGTLKASIEKVLQEKIKLQAASRTDSGVHAKHQVVNFFSNTTLDFNALIFRLNQLLPKDIRVLKAKKMPFKFHPSLDAKTKTYLYYISKEKIQIPHMRNISWNIFKTLDIKLMKAAAKILIGEYDFSAFANNKEKNPIRKILAIDFSDSKSLLIIRIKGVSFLYKMVRNIVGTLIYVGLKKIKIEKIKDILLSKDRKQAGPTAPAYGLFLDKIEY